MGPSPEGEDTPEGGTSVPAVLSTNGSVSILVNGNNQLPEETKSAPNESENNNNPPGNGCQPKHPEIEGPFKRGSKDATRCSRASLRRPSPPQRRPSVTSIASRGNWGSKWEFLLSCVGLSVGIGNVWRFPYLAYENGGGAFLIPYLILLTLAGKPMYFMELALGQFSGTGPLSVWACSPLFKGIGAAMVIISIVVSIYYNVVMSYALYYIGQSFQSSLPWTRCDDEWAKDTNCVVRSKNNSLIANTTSSSHIFWERKVLELSPGLHELGGIKWDLALCLFISWVIVILCLVKGIRSSGKVVYFAATFPYVILISLLIAGLTQEGAWDGVKYFIVPDFNKLWTLSVWQAAAGQMFYSLSVSMGALIMYSSYNDFRHNIFQDAMVVSVLDTITSIISGMVIFSVLGAMAHELGVDVKDVVKGGPGLAFVAYPEALSRLPIPQLWSVLFFFMLFMLGLDSEFALLENVLTSLSDEVPFLRKHKLKFTIILGMLCFLLGLPLITRGGQYIFEMMDNYGGGIPLVFIAVSECFALMWVYGYNNFSFDVYYMLEKRLGLYWKVTWKYTSPVVLTFICISSVVQYQPLKYGDYDFPQWADIVGWGLTVLIVGQIPAWALFAFLRQRKGDTFFQKLKLAKQETDDWGPKDEGIRKDWRTKKTGLYGIHIINKYPSNLGDQDKVQPATLKKFEKMPNGCTDNPAFEPDNL